MIKITDTQSQSPEVSLEVSKPFPNITQSRISATIISIKSSKLIQVKMFQIEPKN